MNPEVFYVLVGALAVGAFARWRGWPAPLVITVAALLVSLIPAVPTLDIDGHLLLNLTLPPLLYSAALEVSFVGFRRSMPHIRRLGVGLVLLTALAVGLVAWWIMPELTLAGGLLLGAIVGPPDAVSAAAIGRKLGLPRRVMTVLSGESLINDATSLTLVRVFAAIVAGATVTVWDGVWAFVVAVVMGVVVGLVFGIVLHQLRVRLDDPVVVGTAGLLVPFGAYAIAEHIGGSGVLAVVAMGLYVGFNAPKTNYTTRQQDRPLWLSVDFLLESFVFAYIGLQFPRVLRELGTDKAGITIALSVAVFVVVLLIRPLFVYGSYAWGRMWQGLRVMRWKHALEAFRENPDHPRAQAFRRRKEKLKASGREFDEKSLRARITEPALSTQERAVVSWAGMRGVVTLAMAAALPDLTGDSMPESHVQKLIVVAFVVTVGTLLLQGLTLSPVIKALGVGADEERRQDALQLQAMQARNQEVGKAYLRAKRGEWKERYGTAGSEVFDKMARALLRVERDTDRAGNVVDQEAESERTEPVARPGYDDIVELRRGWLEVRRATLIEERDRGNLSEEVMRELLTAIDAEELALDTRGAITDVSRA
ncbi:cation:proton antiporter [Microbacterium marinilacus]|uniref:Cation:proton antiporter n=1 Tax=Microbacterium marinilacus TaxID=415209 RepID=A0ABP7BRC6_9MICO|nr:cation:proton antiporter [Microbacterium marinilacus]MBY0690402.1 cation:proton antiporter [Microbacterium marinilacus]